MVAPLALSIEVPATAGIVNFTSQSKFTINYIYVSMYVQSDTYIFEIFK